jgi:hypothetical protein
MGYCAAGTRSGRPYKPVRATALALGCPIWTEDTDFRTSGLPSCRLPVRLSVCVPVRRNKRGYSFFD